jgi:hypothetical protein
MWKDEKLEKRELKQKDEEYEKFLTLEHKKKS